MEVNAGSASTVMVLRATRNYGSGSSKCLAGDWIGLLVSGDIKASSKDDAVDVAVRSIGALKGVDEKETAVIFAGEDIGDDLSEEMAEKLSEAFPDIEFTLLPGDQKAQSFIIGLI